MRLLPSNASLAEFLDSQPGARGCVFVPTMGALHDGHASLVRQARALADAGPWRRAVIVSVFVNPTQFNDPGDLARYPRTLDADMALCRAAGADAIYAPQPADIYPPGQEIATPTLPEAATKPGLEDAHRPGHFLGVAQVVKRLLDLVQPGAAVFGEKDWQQLAVVRAMATGLGLPIAIVPGPTVREADGLAMSSRNRFLPPERRAAAAAIYAAMKRAGALRSPAEAEHAMREMIGAAGLEVQYAVVRDAATLMPVEPAARHGITPMRTLIAARLGTVRLIDNAPWPMR